eukprot:4975769-Pyramimonas_sp.AAC.5
MSTNNQPTPPKVELSPVESDQGFQWLTNRGGLQLTVAKPRSRLSASHVAVSSVGREYTSNIQCNIRNDVR